jgi:hypothetical protein
MQQWKKDVRFGIWNIRSLYRSRAINTFARELAGYKLYLVGVQEVRLDKGGNLRNGDCYFVNGRGNKNNELGTGYFVHTQ